MLHGACCCTHLQAWRNTQVCGFTHSHTNTLTQTHTHIVSFLVFFFMKHNTAELMEPGLLWVDTLELCSGINLRLETSQFSKINSNKMWKEKKKKSETAVRTGRREKQPFLPRQPRLLCFLPMQFVKCWRCSVMPVDISHLWGCQKAFLNAWSWNNRSFLLGLCTKVTWLGLGKDHEWCLLR